MACSGVQKALLWLELEQQAEEVGSSIWGGAALPDPVNESVLDRPAFMHGYRTGNLLHRLMSVCAMSNKDKTCIKTHTVLSN